MTTQQPPSTGPDPGGTARREGSAAVGETQRQAEDVARHAGERAGDVVDTARREVRDVVDEARDALTREADERTRHAGGSLRELSRDLHRMSEQGQGDSPAAEYVDALASTIDRFADRMEQDGSSGILEDVRGSAERRPGSFATGAALAGFAIGRLIRNGQQPGRAERGPIDLRDGAPDELGGGSPHAETAAVASRRSGTADVPTTVPPDVASPSSSGGRVPPPPPSPVDPGERR